MRQFDLLEPKSLLEACTILAANHTATAIAGGTAVLNLIKQGVILPETLINLSKIKEGGDITYDAQAGLRIGALATIHDIESSPVVQAHYPILAQACHAVANIRIRHMATLGGNLAHADPQSDPPAALVALDACVEVAGGNGGNRLLKVSEFLLDSYQTALAPDELIKAIVAPPEPRSATGVYLKFTNGSSQERPAAGVAALAHISHGICYELRLSVGAVSSKPVRVPAAEELARNEILNTHLIDEVAAEAAGAVAPIEDIRAPVEYKRHLVRVLSTRAITACVQINHGAVSQ